MPCPEVKIVDSSVERPDAPGWLRSRYESRRQPSSVEHPDFVMSGGASIRSRSGCYRSPVSSFVAVAGELKLCRLVSIRALLQFAATMVDSDHSSYYPVLTLVLLVTAWHARADTPESLPASDHSQGASGCSPCDSERETLHSSGWHRRESMKKL